MTFKPASSENEKGGDEGHDPSYTLAFAERTTSGPNGTRVVRVNRSVLRPRLYGITSSKFKIPPDIKLT